MQQASPHFEICCGINSRPTLDVEPEYFVLVDEPEDPPGWEMMRGELVKHKLDYILSDTFNTSFVSQGCLVETEDPADEITLEVYRLCKVVEAD